MGKALLKATAVIISTVVAASAGIAFGQGQVTVQTADRAATGITAEQLADRIVLASEAAAVQAKAIVEAEALAAARQRNLTGAAADAFIADWLARNLETAVANAIQTAMALTISNSGASAAVAEAAIVQASNRLSTSTVLASVSPGAVAAANAAATAVGVAVRNAAAGIDAPATTNAAARTQVLAPVVVIIYRS